MKKECGFCYQQEETEKIKKSKLKRNPLLNSVVKNPELCNKCKDLLFDDKWYKKYFKWTPEKGAEELEKDEVVNEIFSLSKPAFINKKTLGRFKGYIGGVKAAREGKYSFFYEKSRDLIQLNEDEYKEFKRIAKEIKPLTKKFTNKFMLDLRPGASDSPTDEDLKIIKKYKDDKRYSFLVKIL